MAPKLLRSFRPAIAVLVPLATIGLLPLAGAEPCTRPQGCDFWDEQYHEVLLDPWDTAKLDVIIVPPASPFATRDIATLEKSVDAWEAAIESESEAWLAQGFELRRYTMGVDTIPEEALLDPEIVIVSAEYNPFLLFGIGTPLPIAWCHGIGPGGGDALHQHDDSSWAMTAAECDDGGKQCVVVNTSFLFGGKQRMYDLNSHELGHCLGIGHVGDALDFHAKTYPASDIMSYQYDPKQVHCVSNLNLQGVHRQFAQALGRPSSEWGSYGSYVDMDPADYEQVTCQNP